MNRFSHRLTLETLEERRLLATCHVVRLGDFGAGGDLGGGHSRGDLRFCINKANTEPGSDTILLERAGTINLTGPLPNLSGDVLIAGPGSDQVTIRRDIGGEYRILSVDTNVTAELFGLTITNGLVEGTGNAGRGGGILNRGTLILLGDVAVVQNRARNGGGIFNDGTLTAYFSTISNNLAEGANCDGGSGGGIYSQKGPLTLNHSIVAANKACFVAGGIDGGSATILNFTTVTDNEAEQVGGIAHGDTLIVIGSTISNNRALGGSGGGIALFAGAEATIRDSTLSGNVAEDGGGVAIHDGTLHLSNSTISDNHAVGGNPTGGGGILNGGSLFVQYSTITGNSADTAAGGVGANCGCTAFTSFHHSIVAGNSAPVAPDFRGPLNESGYNLFGNTDGGEDFDPTDLLNVDPLLGPLQNNGGPTLTHALLPSSPAIDAGDPNPVDPPEWDQRGSGFPRIVNGRIDIGAFEVQTTGAPPSNDLTALITADFETVKLKRRR
jgi:parallel beta-helix repeat protein